MKLYRIMKPDTGSTKKYFVLITQLSNTNSSGDVIFYRSYTTLSGAEKSLAREKSK